MCREKKALLARLVFKTHGRARVLNTFLPPNLSPVYFRTSLHLCFAQCTLHTQTSYPRALSIVPDLRPIERLSAGAGGHDEEPEGRQDWRAYLLPEFCTFPLAILNSIQYGNYVNRRWCDFRTRVCEGATQLSLCPPLLGKRTFCCARQDP
jgi:hypothetical protein